MAKPEILNLDGRIKLAGSQAQAVAHIVSTFGPIDTRGAAARFASEFPGVPVPPFFATLFKQAADAGLIRRVSRGVYAPV
jgi:hypothetical protein